MSSGTTVSTVAFPVKATFIDTWDISVAHVTIVLVSSLTIVAARAEGSTVALPVRAALIDTREVPIAQGTRVATTIATAAAAAAAVPSIAAGA